MRNLGSLTGLWEGVGVGGLILGNVIEKKDGERKKRVRNAWYSRVERGKGDELGKVYKEVTGVMTVGNWFNWEEENNFITIMNKGGGGNEVWKKEEEV